MSAYPRRAQRASLFKAEPLSIADRDNIEDLHTDIYRSLFKDMDILVREAEKRVVDFQYKPGKEQELYYLKAKATGARDFFKAYVAHIEAVKSKQSR